LKKKGIWAIILLLILVMGAGYYFFRSSVTLTPEETEEFSKGMIKEFNQHFYDNHGDKPWYVHLSNSEITLNQKGEVLLKLFSKDYVKSGDENEIFEAAFSYFSESVCKKYKVKDVNVQIVNPDNQILGEKNGP